MKNIKNAALLLLATITTLRFNDGEGGGGGNLTRVEEPVQTYGFEEALTGYVMTELKSSEDINLSDNTVDHIDELTEENPAYRIASSITTNFSQWLMDKGVTPEAFNELFPPIEGKVEEAAAATQQA